ncbi:MAG: tRNA (guanosine(46)-N7)-methyltransferase TrmB [Phycisphaerae bacterium]
MVTIGDIIVEPPADGVVIHPVKWFNSPGDVELEIGCGKGGFLLRRAQAHPEKRLIGIEWANKYFKYAADRMARWGIDNVRIMRTDAAHLVKHHLAPQCLSALHVYHPDPWPKKRHHKRRLFHPEFVDAAVRVLAHGGRWAIQTDHAEYFNVIRRHILAHPALKEIPFNAPEFGVQDEMVNTNFEIKYQRQGRIFHRLAVIKCDPDHTAISMHNSATRSELRVPASGFC